MDPSPRLAAAETEMRGRSPAMCPCLARAEKPEQRLYDAALGVNRDFVDRQPAKQMLSPFALGKHPTGIRLAHHRTAGVDLEGVSGLRVDAPRAPDVGQAMLGRSLDGHRDDVMSLREELEGMRDVGLQKVGHPERQRLVG